MYLKSFFVLRGDFNALSAGQVPGIATALGSFSGFLSHFAVRSLLPFTLSCDAHVEAPTVGSFSLLAGRC